MDQCTGRFILNLRAITLTFEQSYERIESYRTATLAACLNPALCPQALHYFKLAATVEQKIEQIAKFQWEKNKLKWDLNLATHCSIPRQIQSGYFPKFDLPIINPEMDLLNFKGIDRFKGKIKPTRLSLQFLNLASTAEMKRESDHVWKTYWIE